MVGDVFVRFAPLLQFLYIDHIETQEVRPSFLLFAHSSFLLFAHLFCCLLIFCLGGNYCSIAGLS